MFEFDAYFDLTDAIGDSCIIILATERALVANIQSLNRMSRQNHGQHRTVRNDVFTAPQYDAVLFPYCLKVITYWPQRPSEMANSSKQ